MCYISYHLPTCWYTVQSSHYETLLKMLQIDCQKSYDEYYSHPTFVVQSFISFSLLSNKSSLIHITLKI